ncbi:MAG: HNH endonuclease [Corynebacterium sp.]|nr:HNH endonuclease [Corynebacterium sp.]
MLKNTGVLRTALKTTEAQTRSLAIKLWQTYKSTGRKATELAATELGCDKPLARRLLRAGQLLSNPKLAEILDQIKATVSLMENLHLWIYRLPGSQDYLRDLRRYLMEAQRRAQSLDDYSNYVRKRVLKRRAEAKAKEDEKVKREDRERREAIDRKLRHTLNTEPGAPLHLLKSKELRDYISPEDAVISPEEKATLLGLPQFRAAYGTVKLDVVQQGPNNNMLCLSGLTDLEVATILRAVDCYRDQVDTKGTNREIRGEAARIFLAEKIGKSETAARIKLTLVSYLEDLDKEDQYFGPDGLRVTAHQLAAHLENYKADYTHVVIDHQGRVISEFSGRLANAKQRDWHQVENNKCTMCDKRRRLTEHHLRPWAKSKNTNYDNLIPLCQDCHVKVEENADSVEVYYDLGCAAYIGRGGKVHVHLMSDESGSILRTIARKRGVDLRDKSQYWMLRRALESEARTRYMQKNSPVGGNPRG